MKFLIIILFVVYFTQSFQLFSIGTYGFTYIDLFLVIFFITFLKKVFYDGVPLRFSLNWTFVILLIFLLMGLISGLTPLFSMNKIYIIQFFKSYSRLIFISFFAIICYLYEIKPKVWEDIIKMWVILSIFINLFAIYQLIARIFDLPLAWLELTNKSLTLRGSLDEEIASQQLALQFKDFYRATSFFSEPSHFAINNLFMFIMLISPYFQGRKPYIKSASFNIFAVFISIAALFLTFSLTAVLGTFLILLLVFILYKNKRVSKIFIYILFSATLIFISDSIIKDITNVSVYKLFEKRISSILETDKRKTDQMLGDSFGERVKTAKMSVELMQKNPITGIGLGQTQFDPRYYSVYIDFSVLAVLAEMGIFSALIFCAFYIGVFYNLYILLKRKLPDQDGVDIDRLIGTAILLFVMLFQTNFLSANFFMRYNHWFFMAILLSLISTTNISLGNNIREIYLVKKTNQALFKRRTNSIFSK